MAIYLLFIQHIMYSLKDNGKAAIVVPTNFLTGRTSIEVSIREKIINDKMLKGVVSMPSNIFANTGTNVSIMFLDKSRKYDKVLLVDATSLGEKIKDGKTQKTVLHKDEIEKIVNTFLDNVEEDKFSVIATTEQISANTYFFPASNYFDYSDDFETISFDDFNNQNLEFIKKLEEYETKASDLRKKIKNEISGFKYEEL